MIWLACQRDEEGMIDGLVEHLESASGGEPESPVTPNEAVTDRNPRLSTDQQHPTSTGSGSVDIVPPSVEQHPSLALPPGYTPIPVPDAPALTQPLQLARALRPLARQIATGLPTLLDEAATVNWVAETGVWQPILMAEPELWLDVALVFDTSPSMCLWQRFGADLHRLLACYGEFRDVRIWRLAHQAGKVSLTSRLGRQHKPSELLAGDRRRLVAIVSDCVAPAWHNGQMHDLIAVWSATLPTVVIQVFPERLWPRTALMRSIGVELQAKQPGLPSDQLQPFARSVWDHERLQQSLTQPRVRLPIVTLEQGALSSWSRMVAGDRKARALGIVWDAAPAMMSAPSPTSESLPSLNDRLDTFILGASPLARQLAGLLASAPVITLPIVRLIKQANLKQASAVHLAEVFMSGLLKVSGDHRPTFENAERIVYELVDDSVRDRLRAGSPVADALTVYRKVSEYVAQGLGKSVSEFWALLRVPSTSASPQETEFLNAFASVTAKILRGLGREFEAIADSLTQLPALQETADETTDTDDWLADFDLQPLTYEVAEYLNFPAINDFDFIEAELIEESDFPPPLQPDDFRIVTVDLASTDPQLESFDFTVATVVSRQDAADLTSQTASPRNFRPRPLPDPPPPVPGPPPPVPGPDDIIRRQLGGDADWLILRRQQRADRFVETLPDDINLEMVAIPGGSFVMGSPTDEPGRFNDEGPQHDVQISPFCMGRYPVTQEQWRVVAKLPQIKRKLNPDPSNFKGDSRPVERVSWHDAVEFCDRLSAYTRRRYRLPSEAEWEYACRAGTTTPFHFGNMITTDVANYNGSAYNNGPQGERRGKTTPVDHFGIANAFGLSDLHGNVWEWCADHWHDSYKGAPTDGSAWIEGGDSSRRVRRGCSWHGFPRLCRSACRNNPTPGNRNGYIGFRVSCSAPRTL